MKTIQQRYKDRFALTLVLVLGAAYLCSTVFAEQDSPELSVSNDESLPELKDPAGILDPDTLSKLNELAGTYPNNEYSDDELLEDTPFNDEFLDDFLDDDSWELENSSMFISRKERPEENIEPSLPARNSGDVPKLSAANPVEEQPGDVLSESENKEEAASILIDPTSALEELGITAADPQKTGLQRK